MKRIILIIVTGLVIVLIFSCKTKVNLKSGEGFIHVKGGRIWYSITGEGTKIPIVMLHGGPGYPSYYLNPLKALSEERPVITFVMFSLPLQRKWLVGDSIMVLSEPVSNSKR